jgi:hypothetical protein
VKTNPILSWLRWRIRNKKGNNILICGEPGIGKTIRGLRFGELLDENKFTIQKVRRSAESFLEYLNNDVKAGDVCVWDENLGADSADWYTESAKAIKRTMQIMRKKRFTFIQCLPSIEDVIPKARKFFHVYIEPRSYSKKYDGYYCLVMRMQHNPRNKITYFKYFRFIDKTTGRKYVCSRMMIRMPKDKALVEAYETMSEEFKNEEHQENELIIKKEKEKKNKEWGSPIDIRPHILTVRSNIKKFISEWQGRYYIDDKKICNICNVGIQLGKRVKSEVESDFNTNKLKKIYNNEI